MSPVIFKLIMVIALNIHARWITADQFGNFFVVDTHAALVKLDSSGNELYRYQHTGGMPSAPDVTNPFKILLHYPGSGNILFLDNTLSLLGTLDLNSIGYHDVSAACRASDERIWIYDAADHKVKKLESSGELYRDGADLLQHTQNALRINFMREHDQRLYLCDSSFGIIVTDAYGNYERALPIKELAGFQFVKNSLLYFTKSFMIAYDLQTNRSDTIKIEPGIEFHQAVYSNDRLLTRDENGLSLYRRKSP
jgi:hypothetical protein